MLSYRWLEIQFETQNKGPDLIIQCHREPQKRKVTRKLFMVFTFQWGWASRKKTKRTGTEKKVTENMGVGRVQGTGTREVFE